MHAAHGLAKLTRMHTPPHTQAELAHPTLRFVRRGQAQALANVPPTRTLLELLRDDLGHTGTKEGCRSGDCGACTVVLGEPDGQGGLRYRAVNSCIKPAQSIQGLALWTAEDLTADPLIRPTAPAPAAPLHADPGTPAGHATCAPRTTLHPVQQALVTHHASQCGFCTPGFVMSLFAQYQSCPSGPPMDREQALTTLSGNLCRCTASRPRRDAAQPCTSGHATRWTRQRSFNYWSKQISTDKRWMPIFFKNLFHPATSAPRTCRGCCKPAPSGRRPSWWQAAPMWGCGSPRASNNPPRCWT